jgi:hypothetical protein
MLKKSNAFQHFRTFQESIYLRLLAGYLLFGGSVIVTYYRKYSTQQWPGPQTILTVTSKIVNWQGIFIAAVPHKLNRKSK